MSLPRLIFQRRIGRTVGALSLAAISGVGGMSAPAAAGSSLQDTASARGGSVAVAPLTTATAADDGTWAVMPMGKLDQPLETFWEAFFLPSSGRRWILRTPPGVAANGGLVASVSTTGSVFGFEPTNLLHFSPLAVTGDGGASYRSAFFPAGLVHAPDALSVNSAGRGAALGGRGLYVSGSGLSAWRTVAGDVDNHPTPSCPPGLSAVVRTPTAIFVGARCSVSSRMAVLREAGSHLVAAGPSLTAGGLTSVTRLQSSGAGLAALLEVINGGRSSYLAAWQSTPGGPWVLSVPLPFSGVVRATSVTSGAGFTLLGTDPLGAWVIRAGRRIWHELPVPPEAASVIAVGAGRTDALSTSGSLFTDDRLVGGRWQRTQVLQVAVPYGSSG